MIDRRLLITVFLVIIVGCSRADAPKVAIEIDGIKVTADEFEQAYKNSYYAKQDNISSRNAFLDHFIIMKLLLKEAERLNLHKDPAFLKDIEFFWQQALLKAMLERKTRELSLDIRITDGEIAGYFNQRKDTDFLGKKLEDVYAQIKWLLLIEKQNRVIQDWLGESRKKTKIKVNERLLKL